MKRMHVHVAADDLSHAIGFYSALFAAPPSVIKTDYAKWMLVARTKTCCAPQVKPAPATRGVS